MISDSSSSNSLSEIMLYSWRIYVKWKGIQLTHMCSPHTLFTSPQNQGPVMLITSLRASEMFVFIYFFIGCAGSSLLDAGFLQLQRVGLPFTVVRGLPVAVPSRVVEHRLQAHGLRCLQGAGSVVLAPGLQLLCGMWNLPGPGIELLLPALSGIFLSAILPRKSGHRVFKRLLENLKQTNKSPLDQMVLW